MLWTYQSVRLENGHSFQRCQHTGLTHWAHTKNEIPPAIVCSTREVLAAFSLTCVQFRLGGLLGIASLDIIPNLLSLAPQDEVLHFSLPPPLISLPPVTTPSCAVRLSSQCSRDWWSQPCQTDRCCHPLATPQMLNAHHTRVSQSDHGHHRSESVKLHACLQQR